MRRRPTDIPERGDRLLAGAGFEADLWSYRTMRTGHSPEAALAALRHAAGYLREVGVDKPPPAPRNPAERVLFRIDDHFRSHPPVEQRIERLETISPL